MPTPSTSSEMLCVSEFVCQFLSSVFLFGPAEQRKIEKGNEKEKLESEKGGRPGRESYKL